MQVVYDKSLPVFDIAVSVSRLIKDGANIFRMEVPRATEPPITSKLAVIDPDGWRIEAMVVPNPTPLPGGAQHPGCVEIFLQPISAHADYPPQALQGKTVNGVWEPIDG